MLAIPSAATTLVDTLEAMRLEAVDDCDGDSESRAALGQYLTPAPIARFMATLFPQRAVSRMRLLDAGAGTGMLTVAAVEAICAWAIPPTAISVAAYEIDARLLDDLQGAMAQCARACAETGIDFHADVRQRDFIQDTACALSVGMFGPEPEQYDTAIINPPYFKIHSQSPERHALRRVGIETSNIYAGFMWLTLRLLAPGGDLVAITPRSYCNGQYFRPFRKDLISSAALRRFHLFTRRDQAFKEDAVLQETVIVHATRAASQPESVIISESIGPDMSHVEAHAVPYSRVIQPHDQDYVIHLASTGTSHVADLIDMCKTPLGKLGLTVSTGRVVDFRARSWLRDEPEAGTVPLIYPEHCMRGGIVWPKMKSRKAQAIADVGSTAALLVPSGVYVLVKRFSAKEERRRVVAAIFDPQRQHFPGARVGFENHLNYYHLNGEPLDRTLAWGLAAFLNSTMVDDYFRTWSGSTQVNAGDLRKLRYPSHNILCTLGGRMSQIGGEWMPDQDELDQLVMAELHGD